MPDEVIAQPAPEERDAEALLSAAKVESERAQKDLEAAQTNAAKLQAEHEEMQFAGHLGKAVADSGLRFYLQTGQLKKLLLAEPGLDIHADGTAFLNGSAISLAGALKLFASRHPTMLERSRAEIEEANLQRKTQITSRDQLRTVTDKTEFIRKNGVAAFEALPQHDVTDPTRLPTKELLRLPIATKTRLIGEMGELGWARLLERNRDRQ